MCLHTHTRYRQHYTVQYSTVWEGEYYIVQCGKGKTVKKNK